MPKEALAALLVDFQQHALVIRRTRNAKESNHAKTIESSGPQSAPAMPLTASQILTGAPPVNATLRSVPVGACQKPSHLPSGEKNGALPSAPPIGLAALTEVSHVDLLDHRHRGHRALMSAAWSESSVVAEGDIVGMLAMRFVDA